MGDVNFVRFDRIKNEIAEARHGHDTRIWLVNFATLIRRVLKI